MGSSLLASLAVAYGAPFQQPGPGGAARYRSYIWPEPLSLLVTTTSPNTTGSRLKQTGGPGTLVTNVAGGGTLFPGLVNGIAGALITNNPGQVYVRFAGENMNVRTSRGLMSAQVDDASCYRIWANLACSVGAIAAQDQGLYCVHMGGAAPRVLIDAATGFGFNIGPAGVVLFTVRGPNGLIQTPLTAAPFDVTKHHTYEMWIQGATATADASLIALIDGVPASLPALSRSWGAGSNLPPNITIGAISGWGPSIMSCGLTLNQTVHVQQVGMVWGPTLGSLL